MKIIIIDTNILFSAALNESGAIGEILILGARELAFYAPSFLKLELDNHFSKLLELSKLSKDNLRTNLEILYAQVSFIDDTEIPMQNWIQAAPIVREIDLDDLPFVALNEYLDGILWSGDLKLINGLRSKGYTKCITTQELLNELK